ncbi:30S ribosomal protein S8 [bacterium]|nr:30S ribosomal protein S8 [bacterium]
MSISDPIADFLTRIRNAGMARQSKVDAPASRMVKAIAQILQDEGYIRNFTTRDDGKQGMIRIYLKYDEKKCSVIKGIQRSSRPGLRNYVKAGDMPRVLNGLGITILSTSRGVLSDRKAKKEKVGGEIICEVW